MPVQIAHVKASGRENWGKMDRALRMIDSARARGLDVTGDVYPYPAGSTKMDNLLPAWMHDGGIGKLLERLADPAARQRAHAGLPGRRRALAHQLGRHGLGRDDDRHVLPAGAARLHLAELARRTGTSPADAMMDLVLEERAGVSMIGSRRARTTSPWPSATPTR